MPGKNKLGLRRGTIYYSKTYGQTSSLSTDQKEHVAKNELTN